MASLKLGAPQEILIETSSRTTLTTRYRSWSTKAPLLVQEVYFVHHYWLFGE